MRHAVLRPGSVTAGALVLGGVVMVIAPRHVVSAAQVVVLTVAAAWALHALSTHVPPSGWMSPFKWMSPFRGDVARRRGSDAFRSIRRKMGRRRQRIRRGEPLPPAVLRQVKPLIAVALDLDGGDRERLREAYRRLSPLTRAVHEARPLKDPPWFMTLRPDPLQVAGTVERILDDVDDLTHGSSDPRAP